MYTFLIVDDDSEQRETVQTNIELALQALNQTEFTVEAIFPLDAVDDYIKYINAKSVCLLILDEKLNNQPDENGESVDYFGHNLATHLRSAEKDLPIYTITSFTDDEDLRHAFSEYEQIISRKDFYNDNNAERYVRIMLRAAAKFVDRHTAVLAEFTSIATGVATGLASPEQIERMKAIQTAVELPISGFEDRKAWLDEYEKGINALKDLRQKFQDKLSDNELEKNSKG